MISPKRQFLESDFAEPFRKIVDSDVLDKAITHAFAQVLMTHPLGKDEINGIRTFINTLVAIGEKESQPSNYPTKSLDHRVLDSKSAESIFNKPTKSANA